MTLLTTARHQLNHTLARQVVNMSPECLALLRTSTEFYDSPASQAREQETVSLLVATLATTQGPALICWKYDHIRRSPMTSTTSAPCRAPDMARQRLCRGVSVLEGARAQGNAGATLDQVPSLLLPGDNDTPITGPGPTLASRAPAHRSVNLPNRLGQQRRRGAPCRHNSLLCRSASTPPMGPQLSPQWALRMSSAAMGLASHTNS